MTQAGGLGHQPLPFRPTGDVSGRAEQRATKFEARCRAGVMVTIVLYIMTLAAFALPFLIVSCDSVQTESLSGFELLTRKDPDLIHGETLEDEDDAILTVTAAQNRTFVGFACILLATTFAVFALASAGPVWPRMVLFEALLVGRSFIAIGLSGLGTWADVHHLSGYWIATSLAGLALLAACWSASSAWAAEHPEGHSNKYRKLTATAAIVSVAGLAAIVLSSQTELESPAIILAFFAGLVLTAAALFCGLRALFSEPGWWALVAVAIPAVLLSVALSLPPQVP